MKQDSFLKVSKAYLNGWFWFVVLGNFVAVLLGALLPNEYLAWNSYVLYGIQLTTMMPYLILKAGHIKNLFLPSFFVLSYFLVSFTLGSYLVPRNYGYNKEFESVVLEIKNYNIIVPFLLASNTILFILTASAFYNLKHRRELSATTFGKSTNLKPEHILAHSVIYILSFFFISYYDVYQAFSFQLTIMIIHITLSSITRKWYRYLIYLTYLVIFLTFSFANKRELAMAIFMIVFVEAFNKRYSLKFSLQSFFLLALFISLFFVMILSASILRGYGGYDATSFIDAISYIPSYISSDFFVDGITDNLELNYSYGVAVTAMDFVINGRIDYLHGASLFKAFFLPIPRELFPDKPESLMNIFTKEYSFHWWSIDGSLPVSLAAEMFINFHFLGLGIYFLIWRWINSFFVGIHKLKQSKFIVWSCLFLAMTALMIARGSGLDQYILYYLLATPLLFTLGLTDLFKKHKLSAEGRQV